MITTPYPWSVCQLARQRALSFLSGTAERRPSRDDGPPTTCAVDAGPFCVTGFVPDCSSASSFSACAANTVGSRCRRDDTERTHAAVHRRALLTPVGSVPPRRQACRFCGSPMSVERMVRGTDCGRPPLQTDLSPKAEDVVVATGNRRSSCESGPFDTAAPRGTARPDPGPPAHSKEERGERCW